MCSASIPNVPDSDAAVGEAIDEEERVVVGGGSGRIVGESGGESL